MIDIDEKHSRTADRGGNFSDRRCSLLLLPRCLLSKVKDLSLIWAADCVVVVPREFALYSSAPVPSFL